MLKWTRFGIRDGEYTVGIPEGFRVETLRLWQDSYTLGVIHFSLVKV